MSEAVITVVNSEDSICILPMVSFVDVLNYVVVEVDRGERHPIYLNPHLCLKSWMLHSCFSFVLCDAQD